MKLHPFGVCACLTHTIEGHNLPRSLPTYIVNDTIAVHSSNMLLPFPLAKNSLHCKNTN